MTKTHIVLVHGAYHQPLHWDPLVKVLQSAGHAISTPRLPSVTSSPPPEVLKADIASVRQAIVDAIAEGATSIVPVFHSYGGIPGFEALATLTADKKANISRVVCISAVILPGGASVASLQAGEPPSYMRVDGPIATISDPIPIFYNDVEPAAAASAAAALLPHALEAWATPTQHEGCADFLVTYVVCNNDQALPVAYQNSAIEVCRSREGRKDGRDGVDVVTLESGHSPMLSMPEECAKIIEKAAGIIS